MIIYIILIQWNLYGKLSEEQLEWINSIPKRWCQEEMMEILLVFIPHFLESKNKWLNSCSAVVLLMNITSLAIPVEKLFFSVNFTRRKIRKREGEGEKRKSNLGSWYRLQSSPPYHTIPERHDKWHLSDKRNGLGLGSCPTVKTFQTNRIPPLDGRRSETTRRGMQISMIYDALTRSWSRIIRGNNVAGVFAFRQFKQRYYMYYLELGEKEYISSRDEIEVKLI